MNGIFLNVDIESIDDAKKIMELRYDELVEMFNTFRTKLEETKDVYDTSSAKLYREIGNLYLNMGIKYLNNDLKPYIDTLADIKDIYINTHSRLASSVEGSQHE